MAETAGFQQFVRFEMSRGDVVADSGVFASAAPEADTLTNFDVLQDYAGPGGDVEIGRGGISDAAIEFNRWLERQAGESKITEKEVLRDSVVAVVIRRKEGRGPIPEREALWVAPEEFVTHMKHRAAGANEEGNSTTVAGDAEVVRWLHVHQRKQEAAGIQ